MAWSAPRTWVVGEIVTAALMNTHVRDDLRYLKGLDGVPTVESGLTIDNTDGDERLLLPLLSTAEIGTVLNAAGEVAYDEQTNQIKAYDGTAVRVLISEADVDDTPVNGATTVPVSSNWAYDFINILTTQGDMPYATGAGTWVRLAKGTAGQYLAMNAGLTAPEWAPITGIIQSVVVEISAANLLALFTTPKQLVAAPGAGNVLEFCSLELALDFNTAGYTIGAATNLQVKYTNASGAAASETRAVTGFLNGAEDFICFIPKITTAIVGTAATLANKALVLTLAGANVTDGDCPIHAKITYITHATGL